MSPPLPPAARRWRQLAAVVAVLAALVVVLEVVPRAGRVVSLAAAWRAEAATLAGPDPEVELRRLAAERRLLEAEARRTRDDMPPAGDLASVLVAIEDAVREADAVLVEVEPGEPAAQPGFTTLPVRVAIRGDGHAPGRFVSALERADVLLSVREVSVSGPRLARAPTTAEVVVEALQAARSADPTSSPGASGG